MIQMIQTIGVDGQIGMIALGVAIDLLSLAASIKRSITGRGASPVPFLSWCLYAGAVLLGRSPIFFDMKPDWVSRLLGLAAVTVFHLMCQAILPILYDRWSGKRRLRLNR